MKTNKWSNVRKFLFDKWVEISSPVYRSQYTMYRKDGKWGWKNQLGWRVLPFVKYIAWALYPYNDTRKIYMRGDVI
jgi:hypothetical protein